MSRVAALCNCENNFHRMICLSKCEVGNSESEEQKYHWLLFEICVTEDEAGKRKVPFFQNTKKYDSALPGGTEGFQRTDSLLVLYWAGQHLLRRPGMLKCRAFGVFASAQIVSYISLFGAWTTIQSSGVLRPRGAWLSTRVLFQPKYKTKKFHFPNPLATGRARTERVL